MAKKKLQQYVVLRPISPPEGPVIQPAPAATANNPTPAPVLVDAAIVSGEGDDEKAANLARLIDRGVLAEYTPEAPAEPTDTADTKE